MLTSAKIFLPFYKVESDFRVSSIIIDYIVVTEAIRNDASTIFVF